MLSQHWKSSSIYCWSTAGFLHTLYALVLYFKTRSSTKALKFETYHNLRSHLLRAFSGSNRPRPNTQPHRHLTDQWVSNHHKENRLPCSVEQALRGRKSVAKSAQKRLSTRGTNIQTTGLQKYELGKRQICSRLADFSPPEYLWKGPNAMTTLPTTVAHCLQ